MRHAAWIVAATPLVAGALLLYAVRNLGVDTDTGRMVNDDLAYRRAYLTYQAEFPSRQDEMLILVQGVTPDVAEDATRALAAELRRDTTVFESVYRPGGGPFFERQALLYLDADSLAQMVDRVEEVADWLRDLERDPTLDGLEATLTRAMREEPDADLRPFLGLIAASVYAATEGSFRPVSWQALLQGRPSEPSERRRTIIVRPRANGAVLPAGEAIDRIRELVSQLGLVKRNGVEVRLTGTTAIEHEELLTAVGGVRQAGLLALVMVIGILYLGLRSWRLMAASLASLIFGLIGTSAFAAFAVGDLNLISVAFAVLYIGLGIDYAIHLCLRYRELRLLGEGSDYALQHAVRQIGASLTLSAVTTAACFYAFIPTDFAGVSELGVIGGTGMFVSLVTTLTLLPAILHILPMRTGDAERRARAPRGLPHAGRFVQRVARPILGVAGALTLVSFALAPRARFNHNPLDLRDPDTESVLAYRLLLADTVAKPLTISILRPDPETARETAELVEALPEVDGVRLLEDFVPGEQAAKLGHIARLDSILSSPRSESGSSAVDGADDALLRLQASLTRYRWQATPEGAALARQLYHLLRRWERRVAEWAPGNRADHSERLEEALVGSLPGRLAALRAALDARPVDQTMLPDELRDRWIGVNGQHRVEVLPRESLETTDQLRRFIDDVRTVATDVTGAPVSELETGRVAVGSFRTALFWAGIAVSVLLLLLFRSIAGASLVVGPLVVAGLWTGAAMVAFGLRFNFANVIALPLLLGVGVDNGIHMVHRIRFGGASENPGGENPGGGNPGGGNPGGGGTASRGGITAAPGIAGGPLATSTARAVLYSTLTTIASFGNLAFATHVGISSMGKLLTIGMLCVLAATLAVLPALLAVRPGAGR
jgi:hopanoid biosynthesis associated RND transporter like protein HpnN